MLHMAAIRALQSKEPCWEQSAESPAESNLLEGLCIEAACVMSLTAGKSASAPTRPRGNSTEL